MYLIKPGPVILEPCEYRTGPQSPARLVLGERIRDGVEQAGDFFDAIPEESAIVVHWEESLNVQVVHVKGAPTVGDVIGDDFSDATRGTDADRAHGCSDEVVAHLEIFRESRLI